MEILPANSLLPFVTVTFVFLTLLSVVFLFVSFYSFLRSWLKYLRQERSDSEEKIRAEAYKKAGQIMEDARKKSFDLVKQAGNEAQEILHSAKVLTDSSKDELRVNFEDLLSFQERQFKEVSDQFVGKYTQALNVQEGLVKDTLEQSTNLIKTELLREVDQFKDTLLSETIGAQNEVQQKISQEYDELKKELAVFREEEIKRIKANINEIIQNIVTKVLNSSISLEDHQELIEQALESLQEE